jgi:hypothetical protein
MKQHDLQCADCGSQMILAETCFGVRYKCTQEGCGGTHGAHPNGSPVGVPADKFTRKARMRAHEAFDRVWESKTMSRSDAYTWLDLVMGQEPGKTHISMMSKDQCALVVEKVRGTFPQLFPLSIEDDTCILD